MRVNQMAIDRLRKLIIAEREPSISYALGQDCSRGRSVVAGRSLVSATGGPRWSSHKTAKRAHTLDVKERQLVLRLLVKEIMVGFDTLTIRYSIPIPSGDGSPSNIPGSTRSPQSNYPLRPRRIRALARQESELEGPGFWEIYC